MFKHVHVHAVDIPAFDLSSAYVPCGLHSAMDTDCDCRVYYLYNADRMFYDALLKLFVVAYALYLGTWFLLRRQRTRQGDCIRERAAW